MKTALNFVACAAIMFTSDAALAKIWTITASGTVTSISGYPQPAQSGSIAVGDPFKLRVRLDDTQTVFTGITGTDPTNAQYYQPATFSSKIGHYTFNGPQNIYVRPFLTFYNNWNPCGGNPICNGVDAAYLDYLGFIKHSGSPLPFGGMAQDSYEYVSLSYFDFSGSALDTVSPAAIGQLNNFNQSTITYGIFDAAASQGLYVQSTNARPTVAAVPEPATWAQLVVGFGFVGSWLRVRSRKGAVAALNSLHK